MNYQELDPLLLAPKRFVTLAHLSQVEQADFAGLQAATGLPTADLSKILKDLENRELIHLSKERKDRYGITLVRLSETGQRTFKKLMKTLNRIAGE
ncbi:transcriptional regulator [Glutamicibacter sp. NPDC087673]|uniref:transcriptional regulator n=1 Tax=Glutamicibacter sp. NPDC087673 TaxID=3363997 RepID=UPI0038018D5A